MIPVRRVRANRVQHVSDRYPQLVHRSPQAFDFDVRIVGHRVRDDHARLMQPDMALGDALLPDTAPEHARVGMPRAQRLAFADKSPQFRHFGQNHGDDFQCVDLVVRKSTRLARLNDQHAQLVAQPLDWYATKRRKDLFAGLRHIAEPLGRGRIRLIYHAPIAGNPANKTLTQPHARLVNGLGFKTLCRAQLQRLRIAEEINGTDFRAHRMRDQLRNAIKPGLTGARFGQRVLQPPEQLAAFTVARLHHLPALFPPVHSAPLWPLDHKTRESKM